MRDLWAFLLQTLNASAVALLLLLVKTLLADKLSPRWQFGVWSVLGVTLLLPANLLGRHGLFDFPLWVETLKTLAETHLSSVYAGPYTVTRITVPIPLWPGAAPASVTDWLFLVYAAGVLFFLLRSLLSYLRLRSLLRRSAPASSGTAARVEAVAAAYGLNPCRAVEAEGLDSAFVCGVFRPMLVLPAGKETDDKVLLHELLHLKYGDVAWGWVICVLRCLHWCNPLLWYVFDRMGNDCESLCDQRVLERLEGEDRREYGTILLFMANEKYARAPGTSSAANGGANIARRIAAIARFKRYPAGMGLVSVCIVLALASACLPRTLAASPVLGDHGWSDFPGFAQSMAMARTTRCTTLAGALDTYGKAVLRENGVYLAMVSPSASHEALARAMRDYATGPDHWVNYHYGMDLPGHPFQSYVILNLAQEGEGIYTALMVFPLDTVYPGHPEVSNYNEEDGWLRMVYQSVRAEKTGEGWIVTPLEEFRLVASRDSSRNDYGWLVYGDEALPAAATYTGHAAGFDLTVTYQTSHQVKNEIQTGNDWFFGERTSFDTTPKPHAQFDGAHESYDFRAVFTGTEAEKAALKSVRWVAAPLDGNGDHPELKHGGGNFSSSNGTFGGSYTAEELAQRDWSVGSGGGSGYDGGLEGNPLIYPAGYLVEFTVNGQTQTLTLLPEKGRTP